MQRVLLSNDDGVFAPGIRALADAFLADGWAVTVAAPDRERSAAAHSITIKRPIVATKSHFHGVPEGAPLDVWAIDGTPADCVKLALLELCPQRPDVVVSGINNGWNIGTDVHYSGTVGAAMEAAFEHTQAIAVSIRRASDPHFAYAAALAATLAKRLIAHPLQLPALLNLNVPDCAPEEVRGLVEAPMTHVRYTDAFDQIERSQRRRAYWLKGEPITEGCEPRSDLGMLMQGYATVTALGWDLTSHGACDIYLQD